MGAVLSLASTVASGAKFVAFLLAIVLFIVFWGILYSVSGTPNFSSQSPPGTSVARQISNFFLVLIAYTALVISILSFIIGCFLASASAGIMSLSSATGFTSIVPKGGARKKRSTK